VSGEPEHLEDPFAGNSTGELRHVIACRQAREAISGPMLADEIARLTAQADQETAAAFGEITRRSPKAAAVARVAFAMFTIDGYTIEEIAAAMVPVVVEAGMAYEDAVEAVATGLQQAGAQRHG